MRVLPLLFFAFGLSSFGQVPKIEVSGRIGLGSVRIFGSDYSDHGTNAGVRIEARVHRRIGVEFEVDRMLNLSPSLVPCGLTVACAGSGVAGTRSVLHMSGNVLYYFGRSNALAPYVLGGVGSLHSTRAHAITFTGSPGPRIVQQPDKKDQGISIGVGAGIRIPAGRRFSLRPEVRLYDSSLRSRSNLNLIQTGVLLGYSW